MIVLFFIIVLEMSFLVHIFFIVRYISSKNDKDFRGFLVTSVTNIFMAVFLVVFIILFPQQLKEINFDRFLFLESGVIFFMMLYIKAKISIKIYKKYQDPANYHYSHFGKKVVHLSAVSGADVMVYFITLPFTLICGAYFVVKLSCSN